MVVCTGCQKVFKDQQGIQKHRRACHSSKRLTASLVQKHRMLHHKKAGTLGDKNNQHPNHEFDMHDVQEHQAEYEPQQVSADIEMATSPPASTTSTYLYTQPPPTRSGRIRKFPRHFDDFLPDTRANAKKIPHMPVPVPKPLSAREPSPEPITPARSPSLSPPPCNEPEWHESQPDTFGLYRSYPRFSPTTKIRDPDDDCTLDDMCDNPEFLLSTDQNARQWWAGWGSLSSATKLVNNNVFAPFLNATVFRLMSWFYSGSNLKTTAELDSLVHNVLLADDFQLSELEGFSAAREMRRMDNDQPMPSKSKQPAFIDNKDLWTSSTVYIPLNCEGVHHKSETDVPVLEVPGIYHRSLVEVITSAYKDSSSKTFHHTPFRQFWKPSPTSTPQRVFGELYSSDAFLEEHKNISMLPPEPGPPLEVSIAAIMLWSDSTHLANFGTASLWPIYAFFGNQSKYTRAKPTSFAAHHVAYMPTIPDTIQDIYMRAFNGEAASSATLTHIKRELIHLIWELLLDDTFMHAYEHGIVIVCADGVTRRVFPRFFTYSADYPEKVLLATIRYLATCPCPRCHIKKSDIGAIGTKIDEQRRSHKRVDDERRKNKVELTRKWIYEKGKGVNSKNVNDILQAESLVPTRNAFSKKLYKFGFNFYAMFVPDLMHEFELGVWKAVFTHLLRILDAAGDNCLQELNQRYRKISTFGRGTIRKFSDNASSMKKLAARDFEDLLQCSIPVFEGLLPEPHNAIVLDLLFVMCTWHAYAKLRLHTDTSLSSLRATTKALGKSLREWIKRTCSHFETRELDREETARKRRNAGAQAAKKTKGKARTISTPTVPDTSGRKKKKLFNMFTYKLHALGDYVEAIARFGTTDSYSTQVGELEHRRVKRFYVRTNKNRSFERQIARQQRRERLLRRIGENTRTAGAASTEQLPKSLPEARYQTSQSTRDRENIFQFVAEHEGDDALKNFIPGLKDHLLSRLLGHAYNGDETTYSDEERDTVQIVNDYIYRHKVLRVNYTSYDMRRCQDSINPRTHPDIMTLSHEDDDEDQFHPYWYARIIGIFHADVRHCGTNSRSPHIQRMDFLWIRWFAREIGYNAGWAARRLHRVGFLDAKGDGAFEFLDPAEVIRSVHIIPAFAQGITAGALGPSIARNSFSEADGNNDYEFYYVNMFVDRDMFMRFCGGGVGHRGSLSLTRTFRQDCEDAERNDGQDNDWQDLPPQSNDDLDVSSDDDDDMRAYEEEEFDYSVPDHDEEMEDEVEDIDRDGPIDIEAEDEIDDGLEGFGEL